jgi:isoleucyl-tRNA synthetase
MAMKSMFKPVDSKVSFPELEEKIIKFWQKNKTFEKSIKQRSANKLYSFYDGPPFITGLPHYGSLLSSIAKDVMPRYQTMKGKRVRRVWGWDCHGLPAENEVEKILGLKNRRDIEKLGIAKFVNECRKYVSQTSAEWEWYVDHVGRWVDFKNAYKTMDRNYMETVLWVFKQLYDQGLIYKGKRISLFCTRCGTPLSKFEITMDEGSYRDTKDPAVTVKFKILNNNKYVNTYILAWTTTPWTLPANRALTVDPKETYVTVEYKGEKLILAKKRLNYVLGKQTYKQLKEFKGEELLGLEYQPLYNFFPNNKKDMHVYEFEGMVNMDEGTGVVHSAVSFGEIDFEMGKKYGLSSTMAVDDEGKYVSQVKKWPGVFVKDANPKVTEDLRQRHLLFKEETIIHSYPYCYRCDTPLIYKAQVAWYVKIDRLRDSMLKTNQNIYWFPGHFKNGRFRYNIEVAPDWCISRSRYWASPIPVWECDCGEQYVFGSIAEIEKASGQKIVDLHRPEIDKVTVKCYSCGGIAKRVPEVLDCWMESGSMPYAEWHYPFENKQQFRQGFPSDFITEYTGQLRAWFYYLHTLSNSIMKSHCFKNVIVTGVILGSDGKKMSKSRKNYPDPKQVLLKYGGDALRLYLMGSPIMAGIDMAVSEKEITQQVRTTLIPFWNIYRYFITFAELHHWQPQTKQNLVAKNILDKWILSYLNTIVKKVIQKMDRYNIPEVVGQINKLIDDLSKWYIRRSRDRFGDGDKQALATLYQVLVTFCKIAAPIIPFITEEMYKNLTREESVHLTDWPSAGKVDKKLLEEMEVVRKICELGHAARKEAGIKVRQPLAELRIKNLEFRIKNELIELIEDELNIKIVSIESGKGELKVQLDTKLTPELKAEGEAREMVRKIQSLRKIAGCRLDQKINIYGPNFPKDKKWQEYLKHETLAIKLLSGKDLKITVP